MFCPHTITRFKSIFKASEKRTQYIFGTSLFGERLLLGVGRDERRERGGFGFGVPGQRKAPRRGFGWTKVRPGSNSRAILDRCGEVLDGANGAAEEECFGGEGDATEGSAEEVGVRRRPHRATD